MPPRPQNTPFLLSFLPYSTEKLHRSLEFYPISNIVYLKLIYFEVNKEGKHMFIGRETELNELNNLYMQDAFQLIVLYGRRRVGKTTLLNEFCKGKEAIFFLAAESNNKLNLAAFSHLVFQYYHDENKVPFMSWENALMYIHQKQKDQRLILIFDEFPYLVKQNGSILSVFQNAIDHVLRNGRLFIVPRPAKWTALYRPVRQLHELYGEGGAQFEKSHFRSQDGAIPFEIIRLQDKHAFS